MSRAPFCVSMLGYTLARGGRATEARRLLTELEERALRGEFIPAFSRLGVYIGLGDMDGVRRELTIALSEATPPSSLCVPSGPLLAEFRTDPEVARLLDAWDRGDDPGATARASSCAQGAPRSYHSDQFQRPDHAQSAGAFHVCTSLSNHLRE